MSEKPLPLIFVRHGETDWNRQGLIQGSVETDLNENGHAQAKHVAQLLAAREDRLQGFDIIVSPQRRAMQTARHVIEALGRTAHVIDLKVRELEFGEWEGKPFWELKASPIYPADKEGRYFWRPNGGESYEDGVARVKTLHASLTRPTLIIAHGAVGRCLMGFAAKLTPTDIVSLPTPQGCFCDLSNGKVEWFDGSENRA
jgi:broad specificity phosphatase PhoE